MGRNVRVVTALFGGACAVWIGCSSDGAAPSEPSGGATTSASTGGAGGTAMTGGHSGTGGGVATGGQAGGGTAGTSGQAGGGATAGGGQAGSGGTATTGGQAGGGGAGASGSAGVGGKGGASGGGGAKCTPDGTHAPAASCCSKEVDGQGDCCTGKACCGSQNHSHFVGKDCYCDTGYDWVTSDQTDLRCTPILYPDLVLDTFLFSYQTSTTPTGQVKLCINDGTSTDQYVKVKNVGKAAAGPFHVALGIQSAAGPQSFFCATRLVYSSSTTLGVGQTATWTGPFCCTIPVANVPTGDYHLRAYADYDNEVDESSESNNDATGSTSFHVVGGDQDICPGAKWTNPTACSDCLRAKCCSQASACVADASCLDCWGGKSTSCTTNMHWTAVVSCRSSSCATECGAGGSTGSGGTNGSTCDPKVCKSYGDSLPGGGYWCSQYCSGSTCVDGGCQFF